jgi:hypothetical protein
MKPSTLLRNSGMACSDQSNIGYQDEPSYVMPMLAGEPPRFHEATRLGDDDSIRETEHVEDRLPFESLLVELTAKFVNMPIHAIDGEISQSVGRLRQFLGIERSSFAQFSEEKRDMVVTHCYVAPGIEPFPPVIVEENLPWYAAQIRRGVSLRPAGL